MLNNGIQGTLFTTIKQKVATIEFSHPASNSFPSELLARLSNELNTLSNNDEVAVIILKSEGEKAFCAGASFDELIAINSFNDGKDFFLGFANIINAIRTCQKLIICRVQGKAVGGGVGLIAACDYAMATEQAAIKLSEISIGIGPFVIAPAIERKIGLAGLSELSLDASSWKSAYWAKEKGLYSQVFETIHDLDKEVDLFALKLATYNPDALKALKNVFWQNTQHWSELLPERAAISGELVLSEFTKNALAKFSNK